MPSLSSATSIAHASVLGLAGHHTAPSALSPSSAGRLPSRSPLSYSRFHSVLLLQTVGLFLVSQPGFILNTQPRTSYMTSYLAPPIMWIFASSPVSFTYFLLPSLIRARVPSGFQVEHLPPACRAGAV